MEELRAGRWHKGPRGMPAKGQRPSSGRGPRGEGRGGGGGSSPRGTKSRPLEEEEELAIVVHSVSSSGSQTPSRSLPRCPLELRHHPGLVAGHSCPRRGAHVGHSYGVGAEGGLHRGRTGKPHALELLPWKSSAREAENPRERKFTATGVPIPTTIRIEQRGGRRSPSSSALLYAMLTLFCNPASRAATAAASAPRAPPRPEKRRESSAV